MTVGCSPLTLRYVSVICPPKQDQELPRTVFRKLQGNSISPRFFVVLLVPGSFEGYRPAEEAGILRRDSSTSGGRVQGINGSEPTQNDRRTFSVINY